MPEFDDHSTRRIARVVRRVEQTPPAAPSSNRYGYQKFAYELTEDVVAGSETAKAKILTRDRRTTLIDDDAEIRFTDGELEGAKKGAKGECSPFADYFIPEQQRSPLMRFFLLEDCNGVAEQKYRADIVRLSGGAVAQKAELVDTFGWMSDLQLRAGDRGLCDKDGSLYYFVTSDCGSVGDCKDGPFITSGDADPAVEGVSYSWTPTSSGTAVKEWDAGELPDGLTIDPATGQISGTPTEAGEFLITLTATGDDDCVATKVIKMTIDEPPAPPPPP